MEGEGESFGNTGEAVGESSSAVANAAPSIGIPFDGSIGWSAQ